MSDPLGLILTLSAWLGRLTLGLLLVSPVLLAAYTVWSHGSH